MSTLKPPTTDTTPNSTTTIHAEQQPRDDRVVISLDPEAALQGLLQVDPESEPAEDSKS
jgi:hypothetical protein